MDDRTEIRSGDAPNAAAPPLGLLVSAASRLEAIRRGDLAPGDRLIVSTRNSIYTLVACPDGRFEISGGLYARERREGSRVAVNGCTAGGHAIFTGILAAPGLFLELSDGTRTTRIRRVRRIPAGLPAAG
jgi:hypothetical protein